MLMYYFLPYKHAFDLLHNLVTSIVKAPSLYSPKHLTKKETIGFSFESFNTDMWDNCGLSFNANPSIPYLWKHQVGVGVDAVTPVAEIEFKFANTKLYPSHLKSHLFPRFRYNKQYRILCINNKSMLTDDSKQLCRKYSVRIMTSFELLSFLMKHQRGGTRLLNLVKNNQATNSTTNTVNPKPNSEGNIELNTTLKSEKKVEETIDLECYDGNTSNSMVSDNKEYSKNKPSNSDEFSKKEVKLNSSNENSPQILETSEKEERRREKLREWSKVVLLNLKKRYDMLIKIIKKHHPEFSDDEVSERALNLIRCHFYDFKGCYNAKIFLEERDNWCERYCYEYRHENCDMPYSSYNEEYRKIQCECANKTRRDMLRKRFFKNLKEKKERQKQRRLDSW